MINYNFWQFKYKFYIFCVKLCYFLSKNVKKVVNLLFTGKKCANIYLEIGSSTFVYFSGKGPFIILTRMMYQSLQKEETKVSSFFLFF